MLNRSKTLNGMTPAGIDSILTRYISLKNKSFRLKIKKWLTKLLRAGIIAFPRETSVRRMHIVGFARQVERTRGSRFFDK
jgi:hypothetical protein